MPLPAKLNTLNQAMSASPSIGSVHDYLDRASGDLVSKVITISANNTSAEVNCFQLTGSVEVLRLFGIITTKTTLANCTSAYFNLYDSTATVELTQNDGVLSGLAIGTIFVKNAAAATTMAVGNNAAGALTEPAANKAYYPFIITQKTAANTYVRFGYATTDAPANATFTIYCEYRPLGTGTLVAV